VDLTAGLDDLEKLKFLTLLGLELQLLGRLARSQSLHRKYEFVLLYIKLHSPVSILEILCEGGEENKKWVLANVRFV
jgi:hypothetical protein